MDAKAKVLIPGMSFFDALRCGEVVWIPPSKASIGLKALLAVSPILFLASFSVERENPLLRAFLLIPVTLILGHLIIPYVVSLKSDRGFFKRILDWGNERIDKSTKKILIFSVLSLIIPFLNVPEVSNFIPISHFFTSTNYEPASPYSMAVVVVGFIAVGLRALVMSTVSKLLAFSFFVTSPIALGYAFDLIGLISNGSLPIPIGLIAFIIIDLMNWIIMSYDR